MTFIFIVVFLFFAHSLHSSFLCFQEFIAHFYKEDRESSWLIIYKTYSFFMNHHKDNHQLFMLKINRIILTESFQSFVSRINKNKKDFDMHYFIFTLLSSKYKETWKIKKKYQQLRLFKVDLLDLLYKSSQY